MPDLACRMSRQCAANSSLVKARTMPEVSRLVMVKMRSTHSRPFRALSKTAIVRYLHWVRCEQLVTILFVNIK